MKKIIDLGFDLLGKNFNKIPFLKKIKGYRTILGLFGLGIVYLLKAKGVGSVEVLDAMEIGFQAFTGLSLVAKTQKGK